MLGADGVSGDRCVVKAPPCTQKRGDAEQRFLEISQWAEDFQILTACEFGVNLLWDEKLLCSLCLLKHWFLF
jgi:hypothetical protein